MVSLFLFAGAAKRGERASTALVFIAKCAADGQLAAMALLVASATTRACGLGALGRGGMGGLAEAAGFRLLLLLHFGRSGDLRLCRSFGGAARFLFRQPLGFLGRGFLGLAIFLGAAALVLAGVFERTLLAAAGFLQRGEAGFLGLTQKLLLKLH